MKCQSKPFSSPKQHAAHPRVCSEPKQSLSKRAMARSVAESSGILPCTCSKSPYPRTAVRLRFVKKTSLARYCFRLSHSVVYRRCRCINLPDVLTPPVYQSAKCSGAAGVSICQMFWLNARQRGCYVYSQEFGGDLR